MRREGELPVVQEDANIPIKRLHESGRKTSSTPCPQQATGPAGNDG